MSKSKPKDLVKIQEEIIKNQKEAKSLENDRGKIQKNYDQEFQNEKNGKKGIILNTDYYKKQLEKKEREIQENKDALKGLELNRKERLEFVNNKVNLKATENIEIKEQKQYGQELDGVVARIGGV